MIIAIVFALTGLVITQIYWLNDAIQLKNDEFDKNISSALYHSIDEYHKTKKAPLLDKPKFQQPKSPNNHCEITVRDSFIVTETDTLILRIVDCCMRDKSDQTMFKQRQVVTANCNIDSLKDSLLKQNERITQLQVKEETGKVEWAADPSELKTNSQDFATSLPLNKIVDIARLDSIFRKKLDNYGINQEYLLAAGLEDKSPELFANSESKLNIETLVKDENTLSVTWVEANFQSTALKLHVLFPGRKKFLYRELGWILGASVVLILILIITFYYSIKTILVQK